MLRPLIAAGLAMAAAPALAQTAPATAPGETSTATTPADPATQPAEEATTKSEIGAAPSTAPTSAPPQTVEPQATPTPAPQTGAVPQTSSTAGDTAGKVAEVVDQEFAAYDTNHDGKLDKTEFGDWMVKLKAMSDPSTRAGTPKTTAWVNSAFSQADADRNRVLTKSELTGFLTQGRS